MVGGTATAAAAVLFSAKVRRGKVPPALPILQANAHFQRCHRCILQCWIEEVHRNIIATILLNIRGYHNNMPSTHPQTVLVQQSYFLKEWEHTHNTCLKKEWEHTHNTTK
mmetsp:Transcript_46066/g.72113  ORF Transcript_46066/g.72113 Transcript_46066/m.72113 type:complete len:110 (+) Transcript_46066:643-972(+)